MSQAAPVTNCKLEKCKQPVRAKGYCTRHYKKWRRGELPKPRYKICKEEKCNKPLDREGYCKQHYEAWSKSRKAQQQKSKKTEKQAAAKKAQEITPVEEKPSDTTQPAA